MNDNNPPQIEQSSRLYNDIASDSFLRKWPASLRWIVSLPAAIIVAFIVQALFGLFNKSSVDVKDGSLVSGLIGLGQTAIMFGLFVYIGAYVAPKYQFAVSIVYLVIATILIAFIEFAVVFLNNTASLNYAYYGLHAIAGLAAGGYAVYGIYKETRV